MLQQLNTADNIGTLSGTCKGIDSTGIKVEIYETSIYRMRNGKLAEQWCFRLRC